MATRRVLSARRAAAVLIAVFTGLTLLPQAGHADPQLTIQQVQARVDQLYQEAAAATERAHTARIQVAQTKAHLQQVQKHLAAQKDQLATLDQAMADYAVAVYTTGGVDPTLQLMLSSNPEDVLARAQALDQIARIQDAEYRRAEAARLAVAQSQNELDQQLAHLKDVEATLTAQEKAANDKLQQAKDLLANLKADQRQRLAQLQAQRQQAAAQASRDAVQSVPAPTVASSGRASAVVAYALAQVGKPYVFGAAGPYSFDCSGLTMMAWAQAGVYLPHSASMQYYATQRISTSDLQPGDLVFFYSGIEHVGIYVGGGTFVHAANPGDGVVAEPLFTSYWMSVIVGAGRV